MAPKSQKAREDRLAKQRICQRRRYAEIKNDPELLAVEKEKRRQKYLKKKAESNSKKSTRSIKEQRKRWKENSKRYRQRKKEGNKTRSTFETIQVNAVIGEDGANVSSDTNNIKQKDPLNGNTTTAQSAIQKVKSEGLRKRLRLIRLLSYYKKKNTALAKKVQRLQKLLKISRRNNEAYLLSVETNAEPSDAQSNTCDVAADDINQPETSSRPKAVPVIEAIKNFYLQDVNSVLCAGKKQQITKNKKKMQKRLLCLPLKDLHRKFIEETKIIVSYSFFCKQRPYWVTFPKESYRDTCGCQIHENIKLLIEALHKKKIILEKNYDQVLSKLSCDSRNLNCLARTCDTCKLNHLEYYVDSDDSPCTFHLWKRVTKEINVPNKQKKKYVVTEKKNYLKY